MSEKEKLIDVLQDNDVRVYTKGNICLNDIPFILLLLI